MKYLIKTHGTSTETGFWSEVYENQHKIFHGLIWNTAGESRHEARMYIVAQLVIRGEIREVYE